MSSTFTPPGDGWIEGPVSGLIEGVGTTNTERIVYWHGDDQRVWHPFAVPSLPTRPGYYVAERPAYGDTVVVELLGSPAGQWVDAGDRNYLTEDTVRALGPLRPLALVEEILNEVALISISDLDPRPVWEQFREGLDAIAAQYGVHR